MGRTANLGQPEAQAAVLARPVKSLVVEACTWKLPVPLLVKLPRVSCIPVAARSIDKIALLPLVMVASVAVIPFPVTAEVLPIRIVPLYRRAAGGRGRRINAAFGDRQRRTCL